MVYSTLIAKVAISAIFVFSVCQAAPKPSGNETEILKSSLNEIKEVNLPLNKTEKRKHFIQHFKDTVGLEKVRKGLEELRTFRHKEAAAAKTTTNKSKKFPPGFAEKLEQRHQKHKNARNATAHLSIPEINKGLEDFLFGGDILLTPQQIDEMLKNRRSKRQAMAQETSKWDKTKPINFRFDSAFPASKKTTFRLAAKAWTDNTCLNIVEGTSANGIYVFEGVGCWATAGKVSSNQQLSLGSGCMLFGLMAHELAHSLSIMHEHVRSDRDLKIKVYEGEMSSSEYDTNWAIVNTKNYYLPYDWGSVMHYPDADDVDGPIFAETYDKMYQATMGQQVGPSFIDYYIMNLHYGCMCTSGGAVCENGGFRRPKNCNTCICPSGWGGTTCSERQSAENGAVDTGSVLQATSAFKTLNGKTGDPSAGLFQRSQAVHWHIEAPAGKQIEIKVISVGGECSTGCVWGSLEIKVKDFTLGGARYCCPEDIAEYPKLISAGNFAIVSVYSQQDETSFKIQYRYINEQPCEDIDNDCNEYDRETCLGYPDWATDSCPKYCFKCTPSSSSCEDLDPDCPTLISYCDNNTWMADNCKKTCYKCDE